MARHPVSEIISGMPEMERLRFQLYVQLPIYQRRLDQARAIVQQALARIECGYLAFSSGKDSLVTAALVWEQRLAMPAVYFDAACAFPETLDLLARMEAAGRPIIRWKCEPLLDTFARCGGPTAPGIERATMEATVYAPIRSLLARYQFDGVFLGLRAEEAYGRRRLMECRGHLFQQKRDSLWECLPIARWGYSDVWGYIVSQGLDYNRAYDRMWSLPEEDRRVSYWAGETKIRQGRWSFLRRSYPDLFNQFAARFPEVRAFI